jgi:hypothetical protein
LGPCDRAASWRFIDAAFVRENGAGNVVWYRYRIAGPGARNRFGRARAGRDDVFPEVMAATPRLRGNNEQR